MKFNLFAAGVTGQSPHCDVTKAWILGSAAMAVTLAISNYLVRFPIGEWLTWGAFSYPVAFLVTDCVNRAAGTAVAARVAVFGFIFGVPLSFFFSALFFDPFTSARIAAASGIAFATAQSVDIVIFSRLRRSAWWLPPFLSSSPASMVDTGLFFFIAFAGTEVDWIRLAAGDLAVKVFMAFVLLLPYRYFAAGRRRVC